MMTMLVVGVRGHIGRWVARGLTEHGVPVRGSSRSGVLDSPEDVAETVRGDLSDPSTFPDLLEGVSAAFIYATHAHVDDFALAARSAGVEHVVLLSSNSVLFPDADRNPVAALHQRAEHALEQAGLAWTFVRPGYLATNTYRWREPIRRARHVRGAFPDAGTPLVHERDVADIAVQALLENRHRQQAYLVLGGDSLTERQQVATIGDALAEPVTYETIDVPTYRTELSAQIPAFYVEAIIAAGGHVPQVPEPVRHDATEQVLGRAPRTFAEWAHDHIEDFR